MRLGLEVASIMRLAAVLLNRLRRSDPLSEPVHLGKLGFAVLAAIGMTEGFAARTIHRFPARLSVGTGA